MSFQQTQSYYRQQIDQCMLLDQYRLGRRLNNIFQVGEQTKHTHRLETLVKDIEASAFKRQQRERDLPQIKYPDLPVSQEKDQIARAITEHQVVIIAGETGSGKTTQIPKICLELGRGIGGLIAHTQPRRLAARTVAARIAEELDSPLGEKVGFKIRFTDQVTQSTYIKLMTDGILLAEIQQDKFLSQYDTIIIDEAHERSLNIDFILGYLKSLLPKRPDLKLIITSATIDPERFSKHFDDAPIIQVSGRTYPVEMRYRPINESEQELDQVQGIIQAVEELGRESHDDILVFLSGEREIRDTAQALTKHQFRHTEVLPLYARLSGAEQNKIFKGHGGRRIVLATNVAETSLTVPGIKYVIDPGFARISRYSAGSKVQRLPIEAISQASANQRAGRCGRVSNGICIRLYSEDDYLSRSEFTDPEILRTNLASVILQMLALGLGEIAKFPFVQAPDSRNITDGVRLLEELGAVHTKASNLVLTGLGKKLSRLPVDPRYARMVIAAGQTNSVKEVSIITAGLSIQDPRERPHEKRQAADQQHAEFANKESDFLSLLALWNAFIEQQRALSASQLRAWCKKHYLNFMRMREWQDIVSQLKRAVAEIGLGNSKQEADYQAIHQAIATGLLSHLGNKDKDREYLGARNSRFMIFPGSSLGKTQPKWIMVAELMETSRLFGRVVAKIDPAWIEGIASHLVKKSYSEAHWSKKMGAVQAYENVNLYGLCIVSQRRINYSQIDPAACRALFIREALVNGDTKLQYAFLQHNHQQVEQIEELEDRVRRRDLLVDEEVLVDFYAQRLPEHVLSEVSFKKWWRGKSQTEPKLLKFSSSSLLKKDPLQHTDKLFPKLWQQGNLRLPLTYHFEPKDEDDGVSVLIPLGLLNQLKPEGFDWLVPGLRHELIVSLIKSLPKKLRRNFVPAPDFADACIADMAAHNKKGKPVGFLAALTYKLKRMTGIEVELEDWQIAKLDRHLKMNFKVLDEKGQLLQQNRDLHELQFALQGKVKKNLQSTATPGIERSKLTEWDFSELPAEFISQTAGYEIRAFPALVENQQSVDIKLFEREDSAAEAHQFGVRKLILLNIPSPIKYLQEKLPNKAKLGLYFTSFGKINTLIDDCIAAGIDQMLAEYQRTSGKHIRSKADFSACCEVVRANINERVLEIAQLVEQGLTLAHGIQKKMKGNVPLSLIGAQGDIKSHLSSLVYPGFVSDIGAGRLRHWQRYLQAIALRFEKLAIDPSKDRAQQLAVEKVQNQYKAFLNKLPKGHVIPDTHAEIRWMIEELRVSLFAQQLGTAMPISAKRITVQIAALQE